MACNIPAMGEALATKAGLDPEVVFNAVVIGRNFKPGFRIRLRQNDLRNALMAAESLKASLPVIRMV